jgi:hypothetical protein
VGVGGYWLLLEVRGSDSGGGSGGRMVVMG